MLILLQGRCGSHGVLWGAHCTKQPTFPNPGQIIRSQWQPEGQGQQVMHTCSSTLGNIICSGFKWCFDSLGVYFLFVCKQPDGAESVDSLHSGVPEKKAAGHHRTNSGTPAISVSRASVSSGISTFVLFFFFFFTSTLKQRDSCRCLAASQLTHTLYIWVTEAAASCNVMLDCVEKTLSSSTDC